MDRNKGSFGRFFAQKPPGGRSQISVKISLRVFSSHLRVNAVNISVFATM